MSIWQQIKQKIEELNDEVSKSKEKITKLNGLIGELSKQNITNQNALNQREEELVNYQDKIKALENNLIDCNKQRRGIRDELDKKIVELENSNQSKEEIAKQVIYLTTKTGFTEARENLVEA